MKALICGGRDFNDKEKLFSILDELYEKYRFDLIITGGAKGADFLAHQWAAKHRCDAKVFPANWEKHGKVAGILRNREMLKYGQPDVVIAFPGGKGTADMVKISKKAGIEVIEIEVSGLEDQLD